MSVRRRLAAALVVLGVATSACAPGTPDDPATVPPVAASTSPAELAAQKKAAGIADCPVSDPDTAPVTDGLPDLTVDCLGGGRAVHLAGLRGRPMLINVWAQWCGPCREEAPALAEVAAQVAKADGASTLLVLGVDYDDPRPDDAILFARLSGWTFPQVVDRTKALQAPLRIPGPPQTFLVDADGVVVYRHLGPFASADDIRQAVRKHLGVTL